MTGFAAALGRELPPKLQQYLDRLTVPTNPDYDWAVPPQEQHELANPVEINNQVVLYGNAMLEVAAAIIGLNRQTLTLTKAKRALDRELSSMEMKELRAAALKSSDKNSKALQQAFIEKKLSEDAARWKTYQTLRRNIDKLADEIDELKSERDNCDQLMRTLKHASDNAQTFLSFTKAEMERTYGRR